MYNPQITVDRIKEMTTNNGISLAELNEACGLNKNTIAVSANSKNGLSAKILSDVSKILGCSTDYLLGKTDNPSMTNETYKNGDGSIQAIGKDEAQVTVNQMTKPQDEMTTELIKAFQSMDFIEKIEIMHIIIEKSKKSQPQIQQRTYPVRTAARGGQAVVTEQMTWEEMQELESYKDADEDL